MAYPKVYVRQPVEPSDSPYKCLPCDQVFKSKQAQSRHMTGNDHQVKTTIRAKMRFTGVVPVPSTAASSSDPVPKGVIKKAMPS